MKKLIVSLWLILIAAIVTDCKPSTTKSTDNQAAAQPATPLTRYTLNGYTYAQAKGMIQTFQIDQTIYNVQTSVYFNSTAFHAMVSQLTADGADGFRVYFARVPNQNQNTVVILSTFDGGTDANAATGETHQDYFQNSLISANVSDLNGVAVYNTDNGGATLYTNPHCSAIDPCPSDPKNPHYITCVKAKKMVDSFVSKDPNDDVNGHSEWFDITILQDLDGILQKSPNDSGLRMYFSTRIDMPTDDDGNYYDGVVAIVTKMINNVRRDQYICLPLRTPKFRNPLDGTGGGTDNGEQCPTNCGGTTWP